MLNVAVAIMAHHSRVDRLPALIERLKPAAPHVEIDPAQHGPWWTARRCWEACPRGASHMLIVQDDVRLCLDFYATVSRLVRYRPNSPLALYANHQAVVQARSQNKAWTKIPRSHNQGGVWGQAQLLPAALIGPFLAWWRARPLADLVEQEGVRNPWLWHDDWVLGQFLKSCSVDVWATVPSLVEHDCPSDSTIGYSNKNKVARWYIGDRVSGLSIDWRP